MGTMVFQMSGVSIVCSTVCSGADQGKYQSSAPLAFVRWIHQCPVDSPHKGPVTRKMFPFDDVIMPHTVIVFTHALLWKHNERHLQIPVYMPENWMNAKYFQVISYSRMVPTLIFFLLAIFPWLTQTSTSWEQPQSTVSVRHGHYPYSLCHVTNAMLNSTDGKFYMFGDSSLAEKCQKISAIWDFEAKEVRKY